jgi:hypothetical protein
LNIVDRLETTDAYCRKIFQKPKKNPSLRPKYAITYSTQLNLIPHPGKIHFHPELGGSFAHVMAAIFSPRFTNAFSGKMLKPLIQSRNSN